MTLLQQNAVSLASLTSFKIGGTAREYYEPLDLEELRELLKQLHRCGKSPFVLGGGANTLFPDGQFSRPVISTARLRGLTISENIIRAECGVGLGSLIRAAVQQGLAGLESLVGIPGTAGGAVAMNAGGSGHSFGDHVKELGLLPIDGSPLVRRRGSDINWTYRSANLGLNVVAWVALELSPGSPTDLRSRAREFMRRKSNTQPLGVPSAGCIFRNPPGLSAGKIIDQLGLKGMCCGGARVSERHANFIVNENGFAKAADVLTLLKEVRSRVERSLGIRLETEIVLA